MKGEGAGRLKLVLAAAGLLLLLCYCFVHLPLQELCGEKNSQAARLRAEVLAVQNFRNAHLDEAAYRQELQERLERAEKALPARLSQGEFLGRLQREALGTGLSLLQAMPKGEQQVEDCVALPVELKVAGNYFQLLDFLQRLRRDERFYQLRQLKVQALEAGGRLEAEILLVMFAEEG